MLRCPYKRGDRWYYSHNSGLQAQAVMYTQKTLDGEPTVLLDPNTLSSDGTVCPGSILFGTADLLEKLLLHAIASVYNTYIQHI